MFDGLSLIERRIYNMVLDGYDVEHIIKTLGADPKSDWAWFLTIAVEKLRKGQ